MKKIWNLVLIALVITTTACGQQRGGQGQQGGQQQGPPAAPTAKEIKTMVSDLSKEILLKKDQETKVLALYTSHFEQIESKTKSGRPDRSEMETLKSNFEKSVKNVLTADQQKLYTAYLKKQISERPQGKKAQTRKD